MRVQKPEDVLENPHVTHLFGYNVSGEEERSKVIKSQIEQYIEPLEQKWCIGQIVYGIQLQGCGRRFIDRLGHNIGNTGNSANFTLFILEYPGIYANISIKRSL